MAFAVTCAGLNLLGSWPKLLVAMKKRFFLCASVKYAFLLEQWTQWLVLADTYFHLPVIGQRLFLGRETIWKRQNEEKRKITTSWKTTVVEVRNFKASSEVDPILSRAIWVPWESNDLAKCAKRSGYKIMCREQDILNWHRRKTCSCYISLCLRIASVYVSA